MEYFNKLKKILIKETPESIITNDIFSNIEKTFEITLPVDLKEFLSHYGNGSVNALVNMKEEDDDYDFDDNYDFVDDGEEDDESVFEMMPIISFYYMNDLKEYEDIIYETIKIFKENDRINNNICIFPWGYSDTGGRFFLKINSDGSYGIIIYDRGDDDLFEYDISVTEYLYKIITNEINFELLSDKNLFNGKGYFI